MTQHENGEIEITESEGGGWRGLTIADKTVLRDLTGKTYFSQDEYDAVLETVSKWGYQLYIND